MRGMATVALRELLERRMLLALALALGVLSVLLPLLPFIRRAGTPSESRDLLAWVLACGFSGGLALVLGASVFGRDLSEGRLGFFFSRPVSGLALWTGKLSGAFLLTLGAGLLTLLPATLLGGGLLAPILRIRPDYRIGLERPIEGLWLHLALAAGLLFLLAAGHGVSLAIRSRSAWVILDLCALCVVALAVLIIGKELLLRWAGEEAARLTVGLMAGLLLALLVAGCVGFCVGRTDARREHRAFSLALWACVTIVLAAIGLRAAWYLNPSPDVLGLWYIAGSPRGDWVHLRGKARGDKDGFFTSFLLNARTGAAVKLETLSLDTVEFSPDGSVAGWISPAGFPWNPRFELVTADLREDKPEPRETGVLVKQSMEGLLFSPSGERLAFADGQSVSILETRTLDSVASFRLPVQTHGRWWDRGHFMTPGLLRLYHMDAGEGAKPERTVTILEFDVPTKKLTPCGRVEAEDVQWVKLHPPADRLLVRSAREDGWIAYVLCEGRTGARVAVLGGADRDGFTRATWLSDGRVALAEEKGSRLALTIYSPDGQPEATFDLGEGRRPLLGAEPAPGLLAVSVRPPGKSAWNAGPERHKPRTLLLVDLATGQVRRDTETEQGVPAATFSFWTSDVGFCPEAGGTLSRLFLEREGKQSTLLEVDPVRKTRRVVLAGKP
jgi:hypothetical protein